MLGLFLYMAGAWADTPGEERFFADCPQRGPIQLHDERNPWDVHTVLYTTLGVSEVEVVRVADALIDLPLPGAPVHPFRRAIDAIRSGYHRLPDWTVRHRVGEFVDAWQLPELSLGDASATYSVMTGGEAGPGSGMIMRVHKLVDWMQHVTGDINRVSGRVVGRRHGLIGWSLPGRAVDGLQWLWLEAFHHGSLLVARSVENSLNGVEMVGEGVLNVWHRRPHRESTVFLRMPVAVYRAHELWILEHRPALIIGPRRLFAQATHASLAHRPPRARLADWSPLGPSPDESEPVIVMTTTPVSLRAPASLKPYVVPAAWVLE